MAFKDLSDAERAELIKQEFYSCVEELNTNAEEWKKLLPDTKYDDVIKFVGSIKPIDCECGECVDLDKLAGRIPMQLHPVLAVAKKRAEERTN